MTSDKTKLQS